MPADRILALGGLQVVSGAEAARQREFVVVEVQPSTRQPRAPAAAYCHQADQPRHR